MRSILNVTYDSWTKVILYLYYLFTTMYNLTYHNVSNITEQSYICTTLADNYNLLNRREKDILLYVNLVIAIINLFANTLTIYAITITKQYKIQSIKLTLFLSISDLFIALVSQPLFAYQMTNNAITGCLNLIYVQIGETLFPQLSANILGLLIFDRFIRIKYFTRYPELMTTKKVNLAISIVAGISLLECLIIFIGSLLKIQLYIKKIPVTVLRILLISWDVIFYVWSLYTIKKYPAGSSDEVLQEKSKILTKITSYYFIAAIIIYTPYIIMRIINRIIASDDKHLFIFMFILCRVLLNCNAFVNAFLFIKYNRKSRIAIHNNANAN